LPLPSFVRGDEIGADTCGAVTDADFSEMASSLPKGGESGRGVERGMSGLVLLLVVETPENLLVWDKVGRMPAAAAPAGI